ncbi:predicted protein [Sclerotinia sclerotiorum 1980 UF-70]|uniref:Uncharacterized protein n=1 Tax=Sclerotinia sclerotiorum (strain ATCC 18683 / 1980 / Ss-1) TaxID=665079 RepID=A7EWD6_SCLS1|nr:predicted protein [Sclerotinia sclerotiorum 1980 UF-70]EDN93778.1 predicted protein [Sclerotinia sclerotiorum 1980 UF-70]
MDAHSVLPLSPYLSRERGLSPLIENNVLSTASTLQDIHKVVWNHAKRRTGPRWRLHPKPNRRAEVKDPH